MSMTLDELRQLREQITNQPDQVSDEQLADAVTAIREQVEQARAATPNADLIAQLEDLRTVREAVVGVQGQRAEQTAQVNAEAERLLSELDTPEQPAAAEPSVDGEAVDQGGEDGGDAPADPPAAEQTPELIAASAVTRAVDAIMARAFGNQTAPAQTQAPTAPVGRTGRPATTTTPAGPTGEVARATVYLGSHSEQGRPLTSELEVARAMHERFRGAYQAAGGKGRFPVLTVDTAYPESRMLGQNIEENFERIRAVTSPNSLTAAGGLCAPVETMYDVDVLGSVARPVRDALARFGVERGGITYRPNMSAATALYGAGVWTVDDDSADPLGNKGCYVVDCPGLEEEVIEAIYLCLEFSNITTRFDPEITAANVRQGLIAHTRLAENRLLAKLLAGSKVLSAPQVVGATRDILVNLDKTLAYYRNRHRLDESLPMTWIAPAWVRYLIRADLARQMAAGDWMDALGVADSMFDGWLSRRGVSPVWHLDGPSGLDEVQTITITGGPTGGTFTLTFDGETTAAIAHNATAAHVRAALEALPNINPGDITVAGGPLPATPVTVTFTGQYDGVNVNPMTATGSLTGGTTPAVAVSTSTAGGGSYTVNGVTISGQVYPEAAAGTAIPAFPSQIDSVLFPSGDWLFLDGGSLDLGLVRDSELNSRNRYRQFSETFEGAAHRGVESLRLAMSVIPKGSAVGTIDPATVAS